MAEIHPSSVVDPAVELDRDVKIGPFCHIGAGVKLGAGVEVIGHASIMGDTSIGAGSKIFPFASLGGETQIIDQSRPVGRLILGSNNTVREYVTMQPGQLDDPAETRIGDNNLFMVATHVAHDCAIGNNNIFANQATLAGHVTVGNYANIGGMSAIHQFCHIGDFAFIGGHSMVVGNVIPFGMVYGSRAQLEGLNIIGMKRRGFTREDIHAARALFADLFKNHDERLFAARLDEAKQKHSKQKTAQIILDFVQDANDRGFCQGD